MAVGDDGIRASLIVFSHPRPLSVRKLASRRLLPYSRETAGARVFFARRDLDQAMQALRHPARGSDERRERRRR